MDSTAPYNSNQKDANAPPPAHSDLNPSGSETGGPPPSPIQPGQYAVAGGEEGVFKEPPAPPVEGRQTNQTAATTSPPTPQAPTPQPPPQEPAPASAFNPENQPNPTPYVPPQGQGGPENSSPSGIKKMRLIIIAAGLLLLVILIAALAWFLVFSKKSSSPEKTQTEENKIELPSTSPQRTTGGFSEIPPATGGASPATPGALPQ